ncbi:MAG: glutamate-5-semialdehyde dehydrogenase [Polaribacter sp.]|jgi:glutamate-5-semialdehyde dehydrogenase
MFSIKKLAIKANKAAHQVANLSDTEKKKALNDMADGLRENSDDIINENKKDLDNAKDNGLNDAMIDRLMLNNERIADIALAIEQIATQKDPVGTIKSTKILENGLVINKMSIPLGVIAMIYESRPNVTADAAALCFKAGNSILLKGGKEALFSNIAIGKVLHKALEKNNIDAGAIGIVSDPDRKHMAELLTLTDLVDLIIPRGGEGLIHYVSENSRIPVIQHFKGVCHLYIDKEADIDKAISILLNGKVQRPGVCNALETLLVHKNIFMQYSNKIAEALQKNNVTVHACKNSISHFKDALPATDEDFDKEYLCLEIAVKQVDSFDDAISHIQKFSSNHTEVIITENKKNADQFVKTITSSVVMVNASSRFSDGGQLGLGAEIGISTSKLHAYGPMGAESLTTEKFVVLGDGQIRS